jgi:hypothetical protein
MTNPAGPITIELRTADGNASMAYAVVDADRATFDEGRFIAWRRDAAVASYPIDAIAALRFAGSAVAPVQRASDAHDNAAEPMADSATPTTPATPAPATPAIVGGPPRWTAAEDALLRTLSEQHAGLTMMIIKTQRPMEDIIARLTELDLAAPTR